MKTIPPNLIELKGRLDIAKPIMYNLIDRLTAEDGVSFKEKNFDYMSNELANLISSYKLKANGINPEEKIIKFKDDFYLKQVMPQGFTDKTLEKNIESSAFKIKNFDLKGAVYFLPFGMGSSVDKIKENYPSVFVDLGYTPTSVASDMNKIKRLYQR